MRHLTKLDMVLNSILNLVLENLPTDPAVPTAGRIYYNTTESLIKYADGVQWNPISGDMPATDILNALLTVDGQGSGLDADLFRGLEPSAFALVGHTHTSAQITDLVTVIDGRITAAFTNDAVDATVDTIAEFTALIRDNEDDIANILSIKRYQETVGDGSLTSYTLTHNLATLDVMVQFVDVATGETVIADSTRVDANTVDVSFAVAPSTNEIRVIVLA